MEQVPRKGQAIPGWVPRGSTQREREVKGLRLQSVLRVFIYMVLVKKKVSSRSDGERAV